MTEAKTMRDRGLMLEARRRAAVLEFQATLDLQVQTHILDLSAETSLPALLDQADSLEPLPGQVIPQLIRCGKPGCRCNAGFWHGPYLYRVWREGSRVCKAYVKLEDGARVTVQTYLYELLAAELHRLSRQRQAAVERLERQRAVSRRRQKTMSLPEQAFLAEHRRRLCLLQEETARLETTRLHAQTTLKSAEITVQNARVIIEQARELREAVAESRWQRETWRSKLPREV